jgi:hypothetical protein
MAWSISSRCSRNSARALAKSMARTPFAGSRRCGVIRPGRPGAQST